MADNSYDYIVVGAGSTGAAAAYRLAKNGKFTILLLEAGRDSHPWSRIPFGFATLIENPAANWLYPSEPDEGSGGRRIPVPRGKLARSCATCATNDRSSGSSCVSSLVASMLTSHVHRSGVRQASPESARRSPHATDELERT